MIITYLTKIQRITQGQHYTGAKMRFMALFGHGDVTHELNAEN